MKRLLKYFLFVFLLSETVFTAKAQQFLNGSFENCTAGNCYININNATFNSFFTNVKGIGASQTLDIVYDITCFHPAQNGHYYVSLENDDVNPTIVSSISMELMDTLIPGNIYSLSYYDFGTPNFVIPPVEIGVSDNDSTFGTLIYTSPVADTNVWTHRAVNFISPIAAKYVTARAQPGGGLYTWVLIDNFSFDSTVSVNEFQNENVKLSVFPNPSNSNFNFRINEKDVVEKIEVRDLFGRNVLSTTKKEIDLSEFPDGVYLFQLTTKKGKVYIGKLMKQN